MFSVIISEKGGAERRETYDRTEINVGRVQGNDLMLPKGNVSKRHARLLCRDGRFIVTDLKSTNGTYVNGRKIAQATIVREGDKIYIGDFVLRIESGNGPPQLQAASSSPVPLADDVPSDLESAPPGPPPAVAPPTAASIPIAALTGGAPAPGSPSQPAPSPAHEGPGHDGGHAPKPSPLRPTTPAILSPIPVAVARSSPAVSGHDGGRPQPAGPTATPEALALKSSSFPAEPPSSSQPSSAAEKALRAPSPRIEPKTGDRHEVISHFPLEHDPDESVHFAVPAPPRVPSSPKPAGGKTPPGPGPGADRPPRPAVLPTAPGTAFNLAQPTLSSTASAAPPAAAAFAMPNPRPSDSAAPAPPKPATDDRASGPPLERATSPSMGLASLGIVSPAQDGSGPKPRRATIDDASSAKARGGATPAGERQPLDPARAAAQRAALVAMLERVHDLVDLRPLAGGAVPDDVLLARIERALVDASSAVRGQADVDVDALVVEARRELCEFGPLTPLFEDEDVTEIQVVRHDYVVALHGRRQVPSDVGFTSEHAVGRAIRRLCLAAGKPLAEGEVFVERRLARHDGGSRPQSPTGRMFAVLPRAEDHGHMVVIRKPQRADLTLEDLVRSGTISRAMAGLLAQCVAAHANILVTGAVGAGTTTLIGALAGAGSTEDRVVVLQEDDELIFNQPHTISILLGDTAEEGARAVQAAARVRPDRLVVGAFAGAAAAELVDAMGDGVDGVIAGARAPTLRQAVLRLTADIAATKPGLSPEVAREWLASVFDLAIEIARLRDGRHRVLRVAELGVEGNKVAIRDIFTFTVERTAAGGAIEGSFSPTGVVPGILDDLAARGVPVDPSIFRRHSKSDGKPESGDGGARSQGEPSPRPGSIPGR